jgi:probable ATP-dependent RNA helicase DDX4
MCQSGLPTTSIHGDRFQREREEELEDFKRKPILLATAVAARGLDIENVQHVINYDLPKSIEEYVHGVGRTGWLGNTGRATSFYDIVEDSRLAADLVHVLADAQQTVLSWLADEARRNPQGHSGSYKAPAAGSTNSFGGKDFRTGPNYNGGNSSTSQLAGG